MQRPSGAVEHNPLHEKNILPTATMCVVVWVCEAHVAVGCPQGAGQTYSATSRAG